MRLHRVAGDAHETCANPISGPIRDNGLRRGATVPAGLSAALVLGRASRRVLLCDTGTPRSWASKEMHAYLSRDGIAPNRFLDIARREVLKYPDVRLAPVEILSARRDKAQFRVELAGRQPVRARKLLIATGLFDTIPRIPGIDEMFGRSVFQCPYCDGWEMRGKRIAAAEGARAAFGINRTLTREDFDRRAGRRRPRR